MDNPSAPANIPASIPVVTPETGYVTLSIPVITPPDNPDRQIGLNGTPSSNPADIPKRKKDQRPTLTLKGDDFDLEFRSLINKAAQVAGMTQAQFVAETLRRESVRIIKGTPSDTPTANPIALPTERLDAQDRRLAELADQVRRLSELQQRSLWRRVWGLMGGTASAA